jgi:tRNA (cytidine/uridine-2'-O-)-methyltransferase
LSRYGIKTPNQLVLNSKEPIYFIFGKESLGIPKNILKQNKNNTVRIPMSENIRSLNLSNAVAIIGYEFAKQNKYRSLSLTEPFKPIF